MSAGNSNKRGLVAVVLFMIFFPFILVGIALTVWMVSEWWTVFQINTNSEMVRAEVIDKESFNKSTSRNRFTTVYNIEYTFKANNQVYTRTQSVNAELYNRLEIGSPVEVRYLPTNIDGASIVGAENYDNLILSTLLGVVSNCVVMFFLFLIARVLKKPDGNAG